MTLPNAIRSPARGLPTVGSPGPQRMVDPRRVCTHLPRDNHARAGSRERGVGAGTPELGRGRWNLLDVLIGELERCGIGRYDEPSATSFRAKEAG